jgi:peptide/nickel transport system permease protein
VSKAIASFLLRRLAGLVLTLLVASFVIFAALYLAPGNPLAFLTKGRSVSPEALARIKAHYHLSAPFLERYWLWLRDVLRGRLGESITSHEPVWSLIKVRAPVTLLLAAYAGILIVFGGIGLGWLASLGGRFVGTIAGALATVGLATPAFVAAIVLVSIFSVDLGWFPVFGSGHGFGNELWHLTLPAIALALPLVAYVARITQASIRGELGSEHVETAVARGLPTHLINRRHIVRNAFIPISTAGALAVTGLLAGMVVVEQAFGLSGIGSLLLKAVDQGDFAVVQAAAMLFVAAFVVVNMAIDVLYVLIDPRVGTGARR